MSTLSCCTLPLLNPESTDLGHADSFELMLTSCAHCGANWMNMFCVANGQSGFEPVSAKDAAAILATEPGRQRKEFMRTWVYEHT